jgi:DNA-binding response OmpR family regulator
MSAQPMFVLVVEDDAVLCRDLVSFLQENSFLPCAAGTLLEARKFLSSVIPGAVLLDLDLPDGRGEALIRDLKVNPKLYRVPILVLTGVRAAWKRVGGADAVFWKPFRSADLLARLSLLREGRHATGI